VTKCQSVIESPELVKRVIPPTTTITNTKKQPESSQIITDLFLFFILFYWKVLRVLARVPDV
jgi:hypothetical protein